MGSGGRFLDWNGEGFFMGGAEGGFGLVKMFCFKILVFSWHEITRSLNNIQLIVLLE